MNKRLENFTATCSGVQNFGKQVASCTPLLEKYFFQEPLENKEASKWNNKKTTIFKSAKVYEIRSAMFNKVSQIYIKNNTKIKLVCLRLFLPVITLVYIYKRCRIEEAWHLK